MIVLCAVLSGVEDWVGMEAFAEEKEAWLRSFLDLPNGIPSHDTLSDVMGRIDPGAFQKAFTAWATAALPGLAAEQVCVDGKTVRGSRNGANPAVHLVSAFAGQARWVLAQQAVAEKANEITAIPDLLGLLDLRGAMVSIDAMGCQKTIARQIVEGGADDVLAREPSRQSPSSSGTGDPHQRFVKLPAICYTLGRRALRQVVELASHTRQLGRMRKSDQTEIRLLILDGFQKGT